MDLALSVVSHAGETFTSPVVTPLGPGRCTIGRDQDCNIVLEDPNKHVSRLHASITQRGDSYVIAAESHVNAVIVNGSSFVAGQSRVLSAGDEIAIGDYLFQVVSSGASASPAPAAPADPFARQQADGRVDSLFAKLPPRAPSRNPARSSSIEALLGPATIPTRDPLLDALDGSGPRAASGGGGEFDDPLAQIVGGSSKGSGTSIYDQAADGGPMRGASASIDDLLGGGFPSGSDPLGLGLNNKTTAGKGFGGGGRGSLEIDHVHDVHLPFVPPAIADHGGANLAQPPGMPLPPGHQMPVLDDPLAALMTQPGLRPQSRKPDDSFLFPPAEKPAAAPAEPVQEMRGIDALLGLVAAPAPAPAVAVEAPPALAPVDQAGPEAAGAEHAERPGAAAQSVVEPPTTPEASLPPPGPAPGGLSGADRDAALHAFLRGAGMQPAEMTPEQAAEFFEECGALCRVVVEGVIGLLLARAETRKELRATDRTMVAATENNALKLMDSAGEALQFVFDPTSRAPGFMAPPQAFADACQDLQHHEIALVAGMRSALMGSVKRFAPAEIEKRYERLGEKSLLANRKAKLWDFFVEFHAKSTDDANDNFDRVFGADFLRAYHEQIGRFKS